VKNEAKWVVYIEVNTTSLNMTNIKDALHTLGTRNVSLLSERLD